MNMQLPPSNNFSIAKHRPAYSDQRQGINANQCKRLRDSLSLDPTGLNLPNLETRVDFYIGKLNFLLGNNRWGSEVLDDLYQEYVLITRDHNGITIPSFLGGRESKRRGEDFIRLRDELDLKNPEDRKKHILDLIEKYNQLKQRIADLMSFPPELYVDSVKVS